MLLGIFGDFVWEHRFNRFGGLSRICFALLAFGFFGGNTDAMDFVDYHGFFIWEQRRG